MAKPNTRHEVAQPLYAPYRYIALTRGQNAIVDLEDFDTLSEHAWHAEWCPSTGSFYAVRHPQMIGGKRNHRKIRMHRVVTQCAASDQVDHKNHDTLDNRKENLRVCSFTENRRNSKPWKTPTSGFRGVRKDHNRFGAAINVNHKFIYLGNYKTAEDAARAYDDAAKLHFGEFAYLNFP